MFRLNLQQMAGTGFEQPPETTGKTAVVEESGAKSGAQETLVDPDLEDVIQRWPNLPEAVRTGILTIVRSVE